MVSTSVTWIWKRITCDYHHTMKIDLHEQFLLVQYGMVQAGWWDIRCRKNYELFHWPKIEEREHRWCSWKQVDICPYMPSVSECELFDVSSDLIVSSSHFILHMTRMFPIKYHILATCLSSIVLHGTVSLFQVVIKVKRISTCDLHT